MPDRKDLILKRLREEGDKTVAYFRALPEAHAQQTVYTTGPQWHARDILAHLVSAERTMVYYGAEILRGGAGAPEDFVIDEFNAAQVAALNATSVLELVALFETARANTIALVETMSDSDFDRIGRHPWFGRVPLEQMLKLVYRHTMIHERDTRKAIQTGAPVPHVDVQPLNNS